MKGFSKAQTEKRAYDAVLFDMDGTLIDSYSFHIRYLEILLAKLGAYPKKEQIQAAMGISLKNILNMFLPQRKHGLAFAYSKAMCTGESCELIREIPKIPGAFETVKAIRDAGILTFLVTNSPSDLVYEMARILGFGSLFEGVYPASRNDFVKVDRCRMLFERYCLSPERVIYVGDSTHDMNLAAQLGMDGCLVKNQYSWLFKEADTAGEITVPAYTFADIRELRELLSV